MFINIKVCFDQFTKNKIAFKRLNNFKFENILSWQTQHFYIKIEKLVFVLVMTQLNVELISAFIMMVCVDITWMYLNKGICQVTATDSDENSNLVYRIRHYTCYDENNFKVDDSKCQDWFSMTTINQVVVGLISLLWNFYSS